MDTAKKNYGLAFLLMFAAMLASFLVFMAAIKGDNMLRIGLAAGGFLIFCGLYLAMLVARKRAPTGVMR